MNLLAHWMNFLNWFLSSFFFSHWSEFSHCNLLWKPAFSLLILINAYYFWLMVFNACNAAISTSCMTLDHPPFSITNTTGILWAFTSLACAFTMSFQQVILLLWMHLLPYIPQMQIWLCGLFAWNSLLATHYLLDGVQLLGKWHTRTLTTWLSFCLSNHVCLRLEAL